MNDAVEADERAPQRLRHKALDLIDNLGTQLQGADPKSIHDARRRLKELRALAILFDQSREAAAFRDAGRELGSARDAKAALEAFDRLRERFATEWTPKQFNKIRRALRTRLATEAGPPVADLKDRLIIERGRIAAWPVDEMHRDDLLRALAKSYRRARRAMKQAIAERTPAAVHAWRRRVKMHWYHSQFLTDVAVVQLDAHHDALRKLSRTLGNHHDLTLIDDMCRREPETFGSARYVELFRTFVARELLELTTIAESAGRELFRDRARNWMLQRAYARRAGTSTSIHVPGFSKRAAVNFPP